MVLVKTIMKLWVPLNVGKFLSNCTTGGCSRWAQLHGVSETPSCDFNLIIRNQEYSPFISVMNCFHLCF
jgi:hypothetical protein